MAEKQDVIVKVEIPFCVSDRILKRPGMILGLDTERVNRYTEAVAAEVRANAGQFDDCLVRAVHFGGGVASNAGRGIATIMKALRESLDVADDAQITMRSAICNISGATMPYFTRAGVGRFDFEMYSLDVRDFSRLNYLDCLNDLPVICDNFLHSYANNKLGYILAYGQAGVKGQDERRNVRRTMLAAGRSHASHVTLVHVCDEMSGSEEDAAGHLEEARDVLPSYGFTEYLPLRFAREGCEDRYTLMELEGAPCIGFGLGATTRIGGVESTNTSDLELYCKNADNFAVITADVRRVEEAAPTGEADAQEAAAADEEPQAAAEADEATQE